MYAMLTGCLPYTVEPFNITALHAKMLENKMNPIPSNLSPECTDLLHGLLTSDPASRIKMPAIMSHPWIAANGSSTLKPHPYPNKLSANDINEDIVEHMVHVLKLKEREEEVTAELLTDRACALSAVYYLLQARLDRYNLSKANVKLKKKSKYEVPNGHRPPSRDYDCHSTISHPVRGGRENKVQLRPVTRQKAPGGGEGVDGGSRLRERRKTLPSELLQADIDKLCQSDNLPPLQKKTGTLPRSLRKNAVLAQRGPHGTAALPRPMTHLNPVRPPPIFPTSISHPRDLNKLRQEMNRHAWVSQPPSQASLTGSKRQTSRPASRQPSAASSKQSNRLSCPDYYDDLEFHEVESIASSSRQNYGLNKAPHSTADGVHFPSLAPHSNRGNHQRSRSHEHREHTSPVKHPPRTNGHWSPSKQFEFFSKISTSGLLAELSRVAESLNISCTGHKGHTVYLKSQSTKFQVHLDKDSAHSVCRLEFQWLQGGSQERYTRLCSDIFLSLST
ncbi:Hormonally up-regulated neu tumor-associated kinase [Geodia barretti]|nr:Hormonally up-regulated neu tumor-associated kinase [Geodia barretti]